MSEANMELVEEINPILQAESTIADLPFAANESRFSRTFHEVKDFGSRVKIAGEIAIIGAEVLPFNELMRYSAAGTAQATTGNSLVAATVFGAATLAIEGLAAKSTADLMDTNHGKKVFGWLNEKTGKVVRGRKMSMPIEIGVAYFGGSAVVMTAKQIEDPARTKEQNRNHGRFTAAWLSGVLAVQWGLAANGIDNPTPVNVAAAVAVTGGAFAGVKVAQKRKEAKEKSDE